MTIRLAVALIAAAVFLACAAALVAQMVALGPP